MASLIPVLVARSYQSTQAYENSCTKGTCPLESSYWAYLPSLAANGLFLALFSLSFVLFVGQSMFSRRFLGFTIAMLSGCFLEILGYVGRIMSWYNPFDQNGFLIQIICLTIAPAFLAAGLYLTLSRIVVTFGEENSRLAARLYPRIFIPCDFVSLMLQAAGGGLASADSHENKNPAVGDNIMVAGLAFQVLTLLIFMGLAGDFALRTIKRYRSMGADGAFDQTHETLRRSKRFKGFLIALAFSTMCIFTRSVYRVAELSEGWEGHLIHTQKYFIGLEGAIVSAAVLALNAFHPGFCFREGAQSVRGAFGFGRRRVDGQQISAEKKSLSAESGNRSASESEHGEVRQPVMEQIGEI